MNRTADAALNIDFRLEVFWFRPGTGTLLHNTETFSPTNPTKAQWSGWRTLGIDGFKGPPVVGRKRNGALVVFTTANLPGSHSSNGDIVHQFQTTASACIDAMRTVSTSGFALTRRSTRILIT
jgi:hypothetical protein